VEALVTLGDAGGESGIPGKSVYVRVTLSGSDASTALTVYVKAVVAPAGIPWR
jgi:hypothetical protein